MKDKGIAVAILLLSIASTGLSQDGSGIGFQDAASEVEDRLEQSLGVKARLIPGSGGVFEVSRDGEIVYSKADTGRFPKPGEVSKILGG